MHFQILQCICPNWREKKVFASKEGRAASIPIIELDRLEGDSFSSSAPRQPFCICSKSVLINCQQQILIASKMNSEVGFCSHSINMQCLPGGGPSGCEVYSVVIDVFQEAVYLSEMGVPPQTWVAEKAAYVTAPKLTISPTHCCPKDLTSFSSLSGKYWFLTLSICMMDFLIPP